MAVVSTAQKTYHRIQREWVLGAILAIALVYRLYLFWQNMGYKPYRDEVDYYGMAMGLLQNGRFVEVNPVWMRVPLPSIIAAGIFKVFGVHIGLVNLFQIAVSLANVYLVYLLGRAAFDRRVGLIAAFLFAIFPPLATYPAEYFMSEPLFAFLITAILFLAYLSIRRSSLALTAATGATLGLACLTRSSGISFAPFLALGYLIFLRHDLRRALLFVAVLAGLTAAVIAPWTVRNYVAYQHIIPLDTIGSYNLWRDNNYEDTENAFQALQDIPNQGDRQSYATQRGLQSIVSHPTAFLWSGLEKANFLWHPELDSYARGENWDLTDRNAGLGYILTSDGLLIVVGLLGAAGIGYAITVRSREQKIIISMMLLWLAASAASTFIFHSEARFRIQFLPELLVMSAVPLARPRDLLRPDHMRPVQWLVTGAIAGWVIAGVYSAPAGQALAAEYNIFRGDRVAAQDSSGAMAWYNRAIDAMPDGPFGYDAAGDAYRRLGHYDTAVKMYQRALKVRPYEALAELGITDALSMLGRYAEAQAHFAAMSSDDAGRQAYAWEHLTPSPRSMLDTGTGAEAGSIMGFNQAEVSANTTFRWTSGRSLVRLQAPDGSPPQRVSIRLTAARPPGVAVPSVTIKVNGVALPPFVAPADWQTQEIPLPAGAVKAGGQVVLEITAGTFIPARVTTGSRDLRELGVAVDWIRVE